MSGEDIAARVTRLEAWVEVVMRTLATLGLEPLLIELDEARGAYYDARTDYVSDSETVLSEQALYHDRSH